MIREGLVMLGKKGKPITTIAVKIFDFDILESLNQISEELGKTWDEVINYSLEKFIKEVYIVNELKRVEKLHNDIDEE
jgi:hypothetical protein